MPVDTENILPEGLGFLFSAPSAENKKRICLCELCELCEIFKKNETHNFKAVPFFASYPFAKGLRRNNLSLIKANILI